MTLNLHIISTNRSDLGHLEPLYDAAKTDERFLEVALTRLTGNSNLCELLLQESDIVFLQGDRTELLEVAAIAIRKGCIIAHAAGGERSKGSTDDMVRDAITKLAHLHYPVHASAKSRLLDLEEEPWRICVAGEIGVDTIKNAARLPPVPEVQAKPGDVIVAVHPVTARPEETEQVLSVVERFVEATKGTLWLVEPNGDNGALHIKGFWTYLCSRFEHVKGLPPLSHQQFLTLMKTCGTIIGNSSCLITEAPHLGVLTVLIGSRQEGRLPAPSDGGACKRILDHMAQCAGRAIIRTKM